MKSLALIAGVGLWAFAASAFAPQAEPPSAKLLVPSKVKAGQTLKGSLKLTFSDGWHGYQNPPLDPYQTPVALSIKTKGYKFKKIDYPTGIIKEFAGAKAAVYEGEVSIPFEIVAPKKAGKLSLAFVLNYQQCNDSTCLPPAVMDLKASITVTK